MWQKILLVISHAPSPNLVVLAHAIRHGFNDAECSSTSLELLLSFIIQLEHINQAAAIILLTPENLGSISGALKDCFSLSTFNPQITLTPNLESVVIPT